MKALDDTTAILVGGTGAIGSELAVSLLDLGCKVAIVARGQTHSLLLESHPLYKEVVFHHADIRDENDVRIAFRDLRRRIGHLKFLIYTAGVKPDVSVSLAKYPYKDWLDCFSIYVLGFFLCFREAMEFSEHGDHIFVISSAITRMHAADLPPFHAGHYSMAKAALDELCKWARREANSQGVLLSRLAPGAVETPAQAFLRSRTGHYPTIPVAVLVAKVIRAIMDKQQIDEQILPSAAPEPLPSTKSIHSQEVDIT